MACQIKVARLTQVDNGWFARSALHFYYDSVITCNFKGDLSHHCAWIAFVETFGDVAHYYFVTSHIRSPVYL